MGSEVVPILLFWALDGFQSCARMTPTPQKTFFFFFLFLASITRPFVFFLYLWGGWLVMPTPLAKTANIADTSFSDVVRISAVLGRGRFSFMCQEGTQPPRKL